MPGMLERFDRHVREQAMRDAEQEMQERMWREQQGMLARGARERLMSIMRGEQPTREPTEQWMQRRQQMPPMMPPMQGGGMLQQRIDGRMVPRRGPMRRPTPNASTVRG